MRQTSSNGMQGCCCLLDSSQQTEHGARVTRGDANLGRSLMGAPPGLKRCVLLKLMASSVRTRREVLICVS